MEWVWENVHYFETTPLTQLINTGALLFKEKLHLHFWL